MTKAELKRIDDIEANIKFLRRRSDRRDEQAYQAIKRRREAWRFLGKSITTLVLLTLAGIGAASLFGVYVG